MIAGEATGPSSLIASSRIGYVVVRCTASIDAVPQMPHADEV